MGVCLYIHGRAKKTEEVGFEPTVGCPTAVFKTAAIGHSATLPEIGIVGHWPLKINHLGHFLTRTPIHS